MSIINRTSICLFEDIADASFLEVPINVNFNPTHLVIKNMLYKQGLTPPTNPETLIKVSYNAVNSIDSGLGVVTNGDLLQTQEITLRCKPGITGIQRFDFSSNLYGKLCMTIEYLELA